MNSANIDIFHMVMNAGLMVQFVLLLLFFFSATSWAIMIMKYRYIKRAFSESTEFIDFFWKSRNLSNAFSKAKMLQGSPVARIFRVGYVELKKSGRFKEPADSGSVNPTEIQGTSLGSSFTGIGNVKRALAPGH